MLNPDFWKLGKFFNFLSLLLYYIHKNMLHVQILEHLYYFNIELLNSAYVTWLIISLGE